MIFLAEVHVKSRWLFMSCVVGRLWPERTTSCSTVESIVVNCPVLQALPTKHHIFQFRLQTHLSFSKENVVHCLCTLIQTCYLVFVDISTSEKKILLLEYFIQDVSGYICDASNHHHLDITNQQPNVSTLLSSVHALQDTGKHAPYACFAKHHHQELKTKMFLFFVTHIMYKLQLLIKTL